MTIERREGSTLIELYVNGEPHSAVVEPRMLLSDFLRQALGLTGTHVGCEQGVCGACTVMINGRPARSCLTFAVQVVGANIETVEGLAIDGKLAPIQEAFRREHGLQCGFCTPGFLISANAFLDEYPDPSVDEIREHMSGNICRCTGYQGIVAAIQTAAKLRKEVTGEL
jgi:aerobic-type carbon monoxide dehydrogenase small subunit (CoxS/CutS family)